MTLLVLVNGDELGDAAQRARLLLGAYPGVCFRFRTGSRRRSFLRFLCDGWRLRPRLIYVMDLAWSGVLAAGMLRLLRLTPFVVDTGDATYALAVSTGRYTRLQELAIWATEWLALHVSSLIVVRGRYHRLLLRDRGFRHVVEVPDCVDPQPIKSEAYNAPIRSELGLNDVLTVGVIGRCTWSPRHRICYGWDIVDAMGQLRGLPIKAVIIGDGDGIEHLRARVRELDIVDAVLFLPRIPKAEVAGYLQLLDVCVSTQTDDVVGWVRTTSKLVLYLQHSRFVLATDVGQASWVLPPEMLLPYSGVVDREHPKRLAARLREMLGNPEILQMGDRGPALVACAFNSHLLANRLTAALSELN